MEPKDTAGDQGQGPTPGGIKAKTPTTEEIANRERLVAFLQSFVKAMLQTGYYSLEHPQAQKSKEGLYETFRELLGEHKEVNFLARFERGVSKDIYIDGVTEETTSLNTVMTSTQSELFLPKFAEYFHRRGLVSFSLKREVTSEELNAFVDIMSESRRTQFDGALQKGKELTRELVDNKIINVSAVFDDDVIKIGRGVPWRVEMALMRLRKDLSIVPMFRHLTPAQMTKVKGEVIEDVIRPIALPGYFVDLLLNAKFVLGDVESLRDLDVETAIIQCIRPALVGKVTELFTGRLPPMDGATPETKATFERMKGLLKKLGQRAIEVSDKDGFNILYRLHAIGILESSELPPELRARIRTERMADEFLQYPDRYLNAIQNARDANTYRSAAGMVAGIFPELVRRGEFEKVSQVAQMLDAQTGEGSSPFAERPGMAGGVLEQVGSDANFNILKEALGNSPKNQRKFILDILKSFGARMAPVLLEVLVETKEAAVRNSVCQQLAANADVCMPALLEAVEKPDQPWFLLRNLINILGMAGGPAIALKISPFANHEHPHVREETLVALHKLLGHEAEGAFIKALSDKDERVAARAMSLLGSMRSKHPEALNFYWQALAPDSDLPEAVKAQVIRSIGLTGDFAFPDGATSVEILTKILSAGKSGTFFGLRKATESAPSALRIESATSLGRIATPKAMAILKDHIKDKDPKVQEAVANALHIK